MSASQEAWRGTRASQLTLIVSTVAISALSLALPIATVQIYDRVLPNQSGQTLLVLSAGVAVVVVLEVALRLARAYLIGFSGAAFTHRVSGEAMRHVLASDLSRSIGARAGFQDLSAIRDLKDFHNGHALTTLLELALAPLFLLLIFCIGGPLVLAPLSLLLAFGVYSLVNGAALRRALARRDARDSDRYRFLIDSLNAVHSVKAFGQEKYLLRRYEQRQARSCLAHLDVSNAITSAINASAVFGHLITVSTIGFGALAVLDGWLSVGSLIGMVLLSGRIMQPVQRGLMLWARYQSFVLSKQKVAALFSTPTVESRPLTESVEPAGALDISDLHFSFKDDQPLINGVSLSLRKGRAISISGLPGCGKTTLLKLVAGLYSPQEGRVLVDGVEASDFPPHQLNRHVGYLTTEGVIFRGTIRDNITRFGDAPLAQATFVANLLGLDAEVAKLPAGLDTMLDGTEADVIPPGLRQRIALARALATKPKLLLFDNADHGLDLEGYSMLHGLLGRLRPKTAMIIVSDDENLRRLADHHFELDGGRLFELNDVLSRRIERQAFRSVRL